MMLRNPLPLAVAAAALAAIALTAWVVAGTPEAVLQDEPSIPALPTPSGSDVVSIEVRPGLGVGGIAKRLEEAGVIRSGRLFLILTSLMGVEGKMVAGSYEFDRGMPTLQVIGRLRAGITMPLTVPEPEGMPPMTGRNPRHPFWKIFCGKRASSKPLTRASALVIP